MREVLLSPPLSSARVNLLDSVGQKRWVKQGMSETVEREGKVRTKMSKWKIYKNSVKFINLVKKQTSGKESTGLKVCTTH